MEAEKCMKCKEVSLQNEMFVTAWDCEVGRLTPVRWSCSECMYRYEPTIDFYREYLDILGRCYVHEHPRFPDEGAKGIEVCRRWQNSFWKFFEDTLKIHPERKKLKRQMKTNLN